MSLRIEGIEERELRYMYDVKELSQEEISDYYGVSISTICLRMIEYGIEARGKAPSIEEEDLRIMYEEECMTIREIADYYGISRGGLYYYLQQYGIKSICGTGIETDDMIEYFRKYNASDKGKENGKNYRQTEKGKMTVRKTQSKRRGLCFHPYNKPFDDSEFHHISKTSGIHIPDTLHRMYPHNVWTGEGMEAINKEAMDFLMYEINEGIVLRG